MPVRVRGLPWVAFLIRAIGRECDRWLRPWQVTCVFYLGDRAGFDPAAAGGELRLYPSAQARRSVHKRAPLSGRNGRRYPAVTAGVIRP